MTKARSLVAHRSFRILSPRRRVKQDGRHVDALHWLERVRAALPNTGWLTSARAAVGAEDFSRIESSLIAAFEQLLSPSAVLVSAAAGASGRAHAIAPRRSATNG
jgi:hypothetical protein